LLAGTCRPVGTCALGEPADPDPALTSAASAASVQATTARQAKPRPLEVPIASPFDVARAPGLVTWRREFSPSKRGQTTLA
jgi:hypothetical protein